MRWPYPHTPDLGRKLPASYDKAQKIFDERVKVRFPTGTNEELVIDDLRKQGFSVKTWDIEHKYATITRGLIFKTVWSVRWRARAGQIEDIWGVHGAIAP